MKAFYDRLEAFIVGLVVIFPVFGTFMPLEAYLQPLTFQSLYTQQRVESFSFTHVVFLGVAALTGYLVFVYWRAMLHEARRGAFLAVLVGLTFVSSCWSADPAFTIARALRLLEFSVIGFYLYHKYDIRGFTRFVTRALAVPVFASFAVLALRPNLAFSSLQGYHNALRGASIDKNSLGELMSFAVLAAGYSLFIRANNRLFAGVVLLGSLVLLVFSRSTTSDLVVLAMAALALYAWILRRRASAGWGIMGAILVLIGFAGAIGAMIYFDEVLKIVGKSATLTGRTDVWRVVLEAIRHRPILGYGYGFWEEPSLARNNIWLELNWAPPHAHSGWLDVMLQLGIVGLSITIVMWLVSLSRAIRLALFTNENGAIFVALIIVNLLIRSWTETVMFDPGIMFWLWFVIAYLHLARMSEAHNKVATVPAFAISR